MSVDLIIKLVLSSSLDVKFGETLRHSGWPGGKVSDPWEKPLWWRCKLSPCLSRYRRLSGTCQMKLLVRYSRHFMVATRLTAWSCCHHSVLLTRKNRINVKASSVRISTARKPRRRRRARRAKMSGPPSSFVAARFAPFATSALGAKIPDENSFPTFTFTVTNIYSLNADANGNAAVAVLPFSKANRIVPASISVGGAITWIGGATADMIQQTTIANTCNSTRIAGYGVKVYARSSLNNTAGVLYAALVPHVQLVGGGLVPAAILPTTVSEFISSQWHYEETCTSLAEEALIVPGRVVDVGYQRFRSVEYSGWLPTASGETESNSGLCSIVLYLNGATANVTQLNVELITHFEATSRPNVLGIDARPESYNVRALELGKTADIGAPIAYKADEPTEKIWADTLLNAKMFGMAAVSSAFRVGAQALYNYGRSRIRPNPTYATQVGS